MQLSKSDTQQLNRLTRQFAQARACRERLFDRAIRAAYTLAKQDVSPDRAALLLTMSRLASLRPETTESEGDK